MAKHKVDITGVNTNELLVLSNKEMEELFKKRDSDSNARQMLINGNLKLVLSIIQRFNNRDENLDDLFQVGCLGLVKAVDNFDLSYNVKLSTYAVPMILGEIKRYLRDNNSLRVSRSIKDLAYSILKYKEELEKKLNRTVTMDEIAKELDLSLYDISLALGATNKPVSIFEPIYNDGGDTIYLYDQIATKDNDINTNLALENAIGDLNERERYIVEERYIIGKTQMELADELGISQAQVSRLEKNAINTLKKVLK